MPKSPRDTDLALAYKSKKGQDFIIFNICTQTRYGHVHVMAMLLCS